MTADDYRNPGGDEPGVVRPVADANVDEGLNAAEMSPAPVDTPVVDSHVFRAGAAAGLVMLLVPMCWEGLAGAGFWAPPTYIAALLVPDLYSTGVPAPFMAAPVFLGVLMQVISSVLLAMLFAALMAPNVRTTTGSVWSGIVLAVLAYLVMWTIVIPVYDRAMLRLNWAAYLAASALWGVLIGAMMTHEQVITYAPRRRAF